MNVKGLVTKIQRFSLHDGPGIRTTIFLKGCPLNCVWCHNPENITAYPEVLFLRQHCVGCRKCAAVCRQKCFSWDDKIVFNSKDCIRCGLCIDNCLSKALLWSAKELSAQEAVLQALNDKSYYEASKGGITVSGGEPLLQIDFFCELAKLAKKHGLNLAMDTCGYASPQVFMKSLPFVDVYLFDLKFIDSKLHVKYTGRTNELILDNFKRLHKAKKQVDVRVPLIPGMTDSRDNLAQIHEFIKSVDPDINITYIPFNALMLEKYNMLGKVCPFS